MSKPRVLFVGRTRYALPLPAWLQKKFDALDRELDYRVLASAAAGARSSGKFELVQPGRPRPLDGVLFYVLLPGRIARAIRMHRPDVIVAEDPHVAAAALLARRLAGRNSTRIVAEVHGNWRLATRLYGSPARRVFAPVADAVDSLAVRRADAVRALSPYTAGLVETVRGRPPDAAFATYSDLSAFTGARRPLPERPTALFVGVLERYKNVDGLADAWRLAAPHVPDAHLRLVGAGTLRPAVEQLLRDLPGQTSWDERLTQPEVSLALDDATTLLLPSRSEGMGRVIVEAFCRARPVVATRVGGIPDLVEHDRNGLLVEPGDAQALADAIVRILSDRELAERLSAGAHASADFWTSSPEEFAARVRALVERIAGLR